jgi:hypothetical protein
MSSVCKVCKKVVCVCSRISRKRSPSVSVESISARVRQRSAARRQVAIERARGLHSVLSRDLDSSSLSINSANVEPMEKQAQPSTVPEVEAAEDRTAAAATLLQSLNIGLGRLLPTGAVANNPGVASALPADRSPKMVYEGYTEDLELMETLPWCFFSDFKALVFEH